ncbi:protein-L-isoaspartate(D-aspartate) O-methyltransferase [Streptacidiphilus sp. BW17]|uniref:methyltransferase, FxLD system n=1 Tax=Streptacidiphilus sp. BW17 TaxID=3156274 RepID=UPI003511B3D2
MNTPVQTAPAEELRRRMVADLSRQGWIRSAPVRAAMSALAREAFLPDTDLDLVYAPHEVVRLRADQQGRTTSCTTAPWLVAAGLEQSRIRPGDTVLEIGTAIGLNAAYLSSLVGPHGRVVSVEIDSSLVEGARRVLAQVGADNVEVRQGDGEHGAADRGPFDVVIATVQAADLPWMDQVAEDGRIVAAVRLRSLVRQFVFEREGDHWIATDQLFCGYVSMQGAGARPQQVVQVRPDVVLRVDGDPVDADTMTALVEQEPVQVWTGVTVGNQEPVLPHMDFYLAAVLDDYGRFHATKDAAADGRITWTLGVGHSATWSATGFAVVALRRLDEENHEIGAFGHGPDGQRLADDLAQHIRDWDTRHRGGPEPVVRAYRAGTPDDALALGRVVDRTHARFTISF